MGDACRRCGYRRSHAGVVGEEGERFPKPEERRGAPDAQSETILASLIGYSPLTLKVARFEAARPLRSTWR